MPLPPFAVTMLTSRRPAWATDDDPVFASQARGFRASHNVHRTWRATRARHGYDWVTPTCSARPRSANGNGWA